MSKVILIGNGPSALESELGDVIDSDEFDAVIRINRGHKFDDGTSSISNYKKFIGSRCDYWIASDLRVEIAMQRHDQYQGIFIVTPKFKFNSNLVNSVTSRFENIYFIPPEYEDHINSIVNFSPKWPSTGVVGIHFAINHFNEVYIHGFDTYDPKYESVHFFEKRKNIYNDPSRKDHEPSKERTYLSKMIEQGKVKRI